MYTYPLDTVAFLEVCCCLSVLFFFLVLLWFFFYVYKWFTYMYTCVPWVSGSLRGQKTGLNPLALELWTVESHRTNAMYWTWFLCKNKSTLQLGLLAQYSALFILNTLSLLLFWCSCRNVWYSVSLVYSFGKMNESPFQSH